MTDPLLETAGMTNVFGDTNDRVFEVTLERLLEEDPDIIVLLYSDGDPKKVEQALTSLPGAKKLTAVKEGQVITGVGVIARPERVLIARALAQSAEHLLLDEPTNHLDIRYQHEVLGLLRSLPTTTVVVLHDLNLAARYCDDVILLSGGRVDAQDGLHLLFTPRHQEVPA